MSSNCPLDVVHSAAGVSSLFDLIIDKCNYFFFSFFFHIVSTEKRLNEQINWQKLLVNRKYIRQNVDICHMFDGEICMYF